MKPWQQWNRFDWSEALLASYFGLGSDGPTEPVRILVVTDDRLCQVVGEAADIPEDVRLSLIDKTVRSVGSNNYWRHASDRHGDKPDYLAHLIVACIAAIDNADMDERSYLRRLDEITGLPASHSIELMADLWKRLQSWLAERPDEYRPLVLPDPRGWTRIGHTTRLAFPSRADQAKLREVLAEQGVVEALPLGVVVGALERGRRGFSKRFIEELDAFEAALRGGTSAPELYETSLWSAVVGVSLLDLDAMGADGRSRWTILGIDDGYEFDLRVATSGVDAPEGFVLVECDAFGEWGRELQTAQGASALPDLLAGRVPGLGGLDSLAQGGLIPMIEAAHGAMEVAAKRDLEFASVALVADSLVGDVQAMFGGNRAALNGTFEWSVLREARLRIMSPPTLDGTTLERCWILHDTPFPVSLRFLGGVRVGDAFLRKPSMLPRVRAVGATSVSGAVGEISVEFDCVDGNWSFPSAGRLINGASEVVVRASFPTGVRVRRVRLISAPSVEAFKQLGDPTAWQIEGTAGAQALTSAQELFAPELGAAVPDADAIIRLGRDVGVFATTPDQATWEIAAFGSKRSGRLVRLEGDAIPAGRSLSDGDRRRWRQYLNSARFADDDRARLLARRVIATARSDKELPITTSQGRSAEDPGPAPCRSPEHARVADLVDICVSLANRKAGLEPAAWQRLGQETLGVGRTQFDAISRAWSEGHLFDEIVSRRWSTRRVMFVAPHLVTFRTERWVGASLQGLALPATRARLWAAAAAAGVLVEPVRSRSGMIPEGLAFRCDSIERLRSVAEGMQLPVCQLRSDPFRVIAGRDVTTAAPGNYERSTYRSNLPVLDGVTTTRWWKNGSPGFWTVRSDQHFTWTHFEASAAFWAVAFAGKPLVSPTGGGRLRCDVAYLPLATARWLSAVSPVRSGPDPASGGAHHYEAPSGAFAQSLLGQLAGFTQRRLVELSTSGTE
jgi:hypothetical protein